MEATGLWGKQGGSPFTWAGNSLSGRENCVNKCEHKGLESSGDSVETRAWPPQTQGGVTGPAVRKGKSPLQGQLDVTSELQRSEPLSIPQLSLGLLHRPKRYPNRML